MNLDNAVIAVNPAWVDFYEGLLLFSQLKQKVIGNYNFANGAPAVGLITKISTWEKRLRQTYGNRPPSANIHQLFIDDKLPCYAWPNRSFSKSMDPVLRPEWMAYFFEEKSTVFKTLTSHELNIIHSCYIGTEFEASFARLSIFNRRKVTRYTVNATATLDSNQVARVQEVASSGLKIQGITLNQSAYDIDVTVAHGRTAALSVVVAWQDESSQSAGLRIVKSDSLWIEFIQYLARDFNRAA